MKGSSNFSMFVLSDNTCTGALSPGASCSFKVSFSPVLAQSFAATVTIWDGTNAWTVTLAGVGSP